VNVYGLSPLILIEKPEDFVVSIVKNSGPVLGETDAEGLIEALALDDGLTDALSETEEEGEVDALGDSDALGL
jgi:hypothetical protein